MEYAISTILIALSALFSGLTLGLLSLDVHTLKRQASLGNADAAAVYPIRRRGNLLLATLLLGNVAVNAALSVFLGSIASGIVAGVTATALILIFGEILPQAIISRHALTFGARMRWFVRFFIVLFYPITYPISFLLDRFLGEELPTVYSHRELMQLVSEQGNSEHSPIDEDEERIIHGALRFSHMRVHEAMTPFEEVVMFSEDQLLNSDLFEQINGHGFSRYPIYRNAPQHVTGVLYAKDLLTEDENVRITDADEAYENTFLTAKPKEFLDVVLTRILKSKQHLCIVEDEERKCVGVITLEDIIEEIIQYEIEDEADD